MDYKLRTLTEKDLPKMHQAFLSSFADYRLPFQLSYEDFTQKFVEKLGIQFPFSPAIFYDSQLVGFMFSALGRYNGLRTAYNGGTGVLPAYRGQHLTQKMYDFILPFLKAEGVQQCILEVIVDNEKAIKAYKKVGFEILCQYQCFKLAHQENLLKHLPRVRLLIEKTLVPDWERYLSFFDFSPSFLDCVQNIEHNLKNELIAEAKIDTEVVGYIIFQPEVSRISQLAISRQHRGMGIAKSLIKYALSQSKSPGLTIINVRIDQKYTIQALKGIGFEHTIDQFEMKLKIK